MFRILGLLFLFSYVLALPVAQDQYDLVCADGDCSLLGEIIIGDDRIIEDDIIEDVEDEEAPRIVVKSDSKRWPKAEVPYVFHDYFKKPAAKKYMDQMLGAMKSIQDKTCIKFRPVKDKNTENYVALVPTPKGCRANVGYSKNRKQTLVEYSVSCFNKLGTLQHELIHALGALHEHSRPDREVWVTVVKENIPKEYWKNFVKASSSEYTTFNLPYNFGSVMHYPANAFSKDGKSLTIIPKNKTVDTSKMGQRDGMTPLDFEMLKLLYKCK